MENNFFQEDRYKKILYFICEYKKIDKYDFFTLLKDKECKYLLLLLLENYKCVNMERLSKDFYFKSSVSIKNNIKKAEEKLYVNREFRERYFEIEEMIKKII